MALAVVDASVIVWWLMEEGAQSDREDILQRIIMQGAIVPGIWALEIANVLAQALRKGMPERKIQMAVANLWELPIEVDRRTAELALSRILALAVRHGLTSYDAAYLELALRHASVLMTIDKPLAKAARAEGLLVMPAA